MTATPTSNMAQTINLLSMPTEVLDEIATLLPRPALHALALTSKKTYNSAVDMLYKTYLNRTKPAKAPFYLFLRTLCERPDLAAKVKRVDIRGWRSEYEVVTRAAWRGVREVRPTDHVERSGPSFSSTEKAVRGSSSDRLKLFSGAALKAGVIAEPAPPTVLALKSSVVWYSTLRDDDDFNRLLVRGVEDAHVVLMLALLPNLNDLFVDGLSPFPLLDWHTFLSRSTTMPLCRLSWFRIYGSINTISEPMVKSSLQILDMMPDLQKLRMSEMAIGEHSLASHRTLPSRKLRNVNFRQCGVDVRLVQKLLDGQQLHHFIYVPDCVHCDETTGGYVGLKDILTPLASSNTTLEKLVLFPWTPDEQSSLFKYEKLKELEIPMGVLNIPTTELDPEEIKSFLLKQFPPTMATLYLRYLSYTRQTNIVLEQLVRLKEEGFLRELQGVRLNFFRLLTPMNPMVVDILGQILVDTAVIPVKPKIMADFGKMFEGAGMILKVHQSEQSHTF
ncbi:hypothetical protein Ptr86124_003717 [Pyrenophora tritici-repentis]|uniref:F-box domain-containing protein n=1 Tax=Pyrenophora tritici-repentis TaxID=45151 RepID=A0A922NJD0_9PLEO|nr:hypothetical protein Ptr86124_003717 [Pyrenophora tritici-repentis]